MRRLPEGGLLAVALARKLEKRSRVKAPERPTSSAKDGLSRLNFLVDSRKEHFVIELGRSRRRRAQTGQYKVGMPGLREDVSQAQRRSTPDLHIVHQGSRRTRLDLNLPPDPFD